MATTTKIGRNERCPCGSGKKYKHCCESKARTRLTPAGWAAVLALAVAVGVLVFFLFNLTQGGEDTTAVGSCPPGQVWSAAHGHCH